MMVVLDRGILLEYGTLFRRFDVSFDRDEAVLPSDLDPDLIAPPFRTPRDFPIISLRTGSGVEISTVPSAVPRIVMISETWNRAGIRPPAIVNPPMTDPSTMMTPMMASMSQGLSRLTGGTTTPAFGRGVSESETPS
jgi:hypothetical protein